MPDEIKVGESTYTAEQIAAMAEENAKMKIGMESVKTITDFAARHGVSVDQVIAESESAFAVMGTLLEKGILDSQGNIVEPVAKTVTTMQTQVKPNDQNQDHNKQNTDETKIAQLVDAKLAPLLAQIKQLAQNSDHLTSFALKTELRRVYPTITDAQMGQAVARSGQDRTKTILQHAKDIVGEDEGADLAREKAILAKHGIDINDLPQQGGDSGAGALVKGQKISFKRGKDSKTPRELTEKYFNMVFPRNK